MPTGKIKQVIDGDTVVLQGGEHVRITNLDAPELNQPGGQAAKKQLQKLLPKGQIVGLSEVLAKSYDRSVRKVTVKGEPLEKIVKASPKR
jgi:endonuclease YncB( thermonuclease family)